MTQDTELPELPEPDGVCGQYTLGQVQSIQRDAFERGLARGIKRERAWQELAKPGIFKTAQIALHAAIEALAAEQFEAGRQQERALWELAKDGQEIG